jgi:hypothetical protein
MAALGAGRRTGRLTLSSRGTALLRANVTCRPGTRVAGASATSTHSHPREESICLHVTRIGGGEAVERRRQVGRAPLEGARPMQARRRRERAPAEARQRGQGNRAATMPAVARRVTLSHRERRALQTPPAVALVAEDQAPPALAQARAGLREATSRPEASRLRRPVPSLRLGQATLTRRVPAAARSPMDRPRPSGSAISSRCARVGAPPVRRRLPDLSVRNQARVSLVGRKPARDSRRGSPAPTIPLR